jgi:hypothetical protein
MGRVASGARMFFRILVLCPGWRKDSGLKRWRRMELDEVG